MPRSLCNRTQLSHGFATGAGHIQSGQFNSEKTMQGLAHIAVSDFEQSIGFYTAMFGREPAVRTHDFASWHSKDSEVHFAIAARRSPVAAQ
jgi:hypothetical protein